MEKETKRKIRVWGKYFLWAGAGLALLVVLLLAFAYFVAVSNHEKVPQLVEKAVAKNTGAEVTFSDYHFSVFRNFPFVSLVLKNIHVRDPGYETYRQELLRIDELSLDLRFWNLFRKEFKLRSLAIDGGQATIFKNTDGSYSNLDFLKKDTTETRPSRSGNPPAFSLDHIRIKDFTFLLLDSLRTKSYHFDMQDTRLDLSELNSTGDIAMKGDWFFHGLTFKFRNGAYLRDKEAEIDWRLAWDRDSSRLEIRPSTLEVEGETYHVSGLLALGKPPFLKLVIEHPGIMLEAARGIIADNIRKALEKASIDRPVQVKVVVEGPLISGRPAPTDLYFSLENAGVTVGNTSLTETSFSGHFYNCDPDGPVDPHSGCMEIDTFSTRISGAIPVRGKALIRDLVDPVLRVDAGVSMPLADLVPVLPAGKAAIRQGWLDLDLHFDGPVSGKSGQVPDLKGSLDLSGGALRYLPTGLEVEGLNADLALDEGNLVIRDFQAALDGELVDLRGEVCDLAPFLVSSDRQLQTKLELRTGVLNIDRLLPPKAPGEAGKPKAGNEQKRGLSGITSMIRSMSDRFNVEMDIYSEGLKVRGYSASDVTIKSRLLSNCPELGTGCFALDTLDARIYGEIPISASLLLTDLDDPRMRMDLQLAGPLTSFNNLFPPEQVSLYGGDISLDLYYNGLLDDYFNMHDGREKSDFGARVVLNNAAADYQAGKFQLREVSADLQLDEDHLRMPNLSLEVNGNKVDMKGQVDDFIPFLFSEEGVLKAGLEIRSPELNFNAFSLGNKAEKQEKRPKAVPGRSGDSSLIARKLNSVAEHLEADLRVSTQNFIYRELNAEEVLLHGSYRLSCDPGHEPYGCVRIDTFSARLFGNAPVLASFTVENLNDPFVAVDAVVSMPLEDLNSMFPPEQLQFRSGTIDLQVNYRGQPHDHFDPDNLLVKADLFGNVVLSGAGFDYVSKGYRFRDINGQVIFGNRDVNIPRLELSLNDNPLTAQGQFKGLIPFLFSPDHALEADLEVSATEFSFDRFSAPAKHQNKEVKDADHEPTPVTRSVNAALDSTLVNFQLSVGKLIYRNFIGQDLYANVHLDEDELVIREAQMGVGNGLFKLGGKLSGLKNNQPLIDLKVNFEETDLSALFESFDDFGQEGISHRNLSGILNAELSFKGQADENYDIDPQSMEGYFSVSIRDGALKDFPMLTKMNNYFIKHRDLDNVRFGSLEKIFRLEDQIMYIDQFELASSLLSFKLYGKYDLQKSGRTDLLFEIPLANLFEGDVSQEALNKYFDRNYGPALLMRIISDEEGALSVKPLMSRRKFKRG